MNRVLRRPNPDDDFQLFEGPDKSEGTTAKYESALLDLRRQQAAHENTQRHQYTLEDSESAVDFLSNLDHEAGAPWMALGQDLTQALDKLKVIGAYLLNPSDQQRMKPQNADQIFKSSFPNGLMIGKKKLASWDKLELAIRDLETLSQPEVLAGSVSHHVAARIGL